MFAANMRARKSQVMAQAIGERCTRQDFNVDVFAVHLEGDSHGH